MNLDLPLHVHALDPVPSLELHARDYHVRDKSGRSNLYLRTLAKIVVHVGRERATRDSMKNEDVRSFYFFFNLNFLDRERKFDAIDPRLIQRRIDDDHSSRDAITCNGNYAMYRRGGNRHSPNTGNSKG